LRNTPEAKQKEQIARHLETSVPDRSLTVKGIWCTCRYRSKRTTIGVKRRAKNNVFPRWIDPSKLGSGRE
jgi:hypothetical protein